MQTMTDIIEAYDVYVQQFDIKITLDEEVNNAIDIIGTGTSLDGIEPSIAKIFQLSMRKLIVKLMNIFFVSKYPDE